MILDKKQMSEEDIKLQYITPAITCKVEHPENNDRDADHGRQNKPETESGNVHEESGIVDRG